MAGPGDQRERLPIESSIIRNYDSPGRCLLLHRGHAGLHGGGSFPQGLDGVEVRLRCLAILGTAADGAGNKGACNQTTIVPH